MTFLRKMHLRQKFALLIAAMALPTVLLTGFYLTQSNGTVNKAHKELAGARYMQSVGSLLARVTYHRTVTDALPQWRLPPVAPKALDSKATSKNQIEQLNTLDGELGQRFGSTAAWHQVTGQWKKIKAGASTMSPEENLAAHDTLINEITNLMARVSKASDMDLDSDAFTNDLIMAATRNVAPGRHRILKCEPALHGGCGQRLPGRR